MARITWVFLGLAIVFAAASGYFALRPEPPPPSDLIVSNTEQDLGEVKVGVHEVTVQLSNPSQDPRRVLGMTELCAGYDCFIKTHVDTIIQAGESCVYKFNLLIKKPGPFNAEGALFLEGNGLQVVPLKIHGIAVSPGKRPSVPRTSSY